MDRETSVTVRRFAADLKRQMHLDGLILFGSRACGDHFVTSDFDFIIVSAGFSSVPFARRAAPLYDLWREGWDMDAPCYAPEGWNEPKDVCVILLNAQRDEIRIA